MELQVTDKRNRLWELFLDESYYHQWCVRIKEDRDFNSPTSFHFDTFEQARDFLNLISISR